MCSADLPEDYLGTVRQTLGQLSESGVHGEFARTILEKDWVKPNKRVFDNSKISDHFAIIPTLQAPKNLSDAEQKVYDLVVRRFMAVFYPAAEYLVTTRITTFWVISAVAPSVQGSISPVPRVKVQLKAPACISRSFGVSPYQP